MFKLANQPEDKDKEEANIPLATKKIHQAVGKGKESREVTNAPPVESSKQPTYSAKLDLGLETLASIKHLNFLMDKDTGDI